MGRKTFESLSCPLPHCLNIIVSRNKDFRAEGVEVFSSLEKAMEYIKKEELRKKWGYEVFIIGGSQIYKQSLDLVDKIYITRIHREYTGDSFYPEIPENLFEEKEKRKGKGVIPLTFFTYKRKNTK